MNRSASYVRLQFWHGGCLCDLHLEAAEPPSGCISAHGLDRMPPGGKGGSDKPSFGRDGFSSLPPNRTLVIVHSLAVFVEQLCARSPDAPSIDQVRPKFCPGCGGPSRNALGVLQLIGLYCRHVRGLSEKLWIVIWVRRFLCLTCGCTTSSTRP
jgi:hypothetical protein